jgi:hydrogenase nickel incorporation protein HypB
VKIDVVANVLEANERTAGEVRERLRGAGVRAVNLIGAPGCGKTALLERTLDALAGEIRTAVITGDLATTRDAERIAARCPHVVQVNTGKGCHLHAGQVAKGIEDLPLDDCDLLFVENVGNLICPVGFDLGQDVKVGMFSVPEGDDKPAKHPWLVLEAGLVILGKIDLLPHVPFDLDVFRADLARIREDVPRIELSATTGEGFESWTDWLRALISRL